MEVATNGHLLHLQGVPEFFGILSPVQPLLIAITGLKLDFRKLRHLLVRFAAAMTV